jgi:hypothetical protein
MSTWRIEIEGKEGAAQRDLTDGTSKEITSIVTSFTWSHSISDPYSQASVSALVPLRDLISLGLGYVTQGRLVLHASGYLRITELTKAGQIERFYGPITAVTAGFKVDKELGTRQTAPLKISASTWLTPLMRGFLVSATEDLNIGSSLISYKQWQKIADAVLTSANAQGLTESLQVAWNRLGAPSVGGTLVGGAGYTRLREYVGDVVNRSIDVYGRNLSQLQPPSASGTVWGVLRNTYQATALVELFPAYVYNPSSRETERRLVYRLRPPAPRLNEQEKERIAFLSQFEGQSGNKGKDLRFIYGTTIPTKNIGPDELPYVISYDLAYSDNRNNYFEVTSPYTGAGQLAGLSCDPVYHKGDIETYGLFRYAESYPYIRSKTKDGDGSIRAELNDLTRYAALVYSFAHQYASGKVTAKYKDGSTLSHGDWVRWRSYGAENHFYVGYITKATHTFTVDKMGVLEGSSTYDVERTEAEITGDSL